MHQAQKLNNYNITFNAPVGNIGGITSSGDIVSNINKVNEIDPVIANLLSFLLQNSKTKDYAEELATNLTNLDNASEDKKKGIIEKAFEIAGKIIVVSETSKVIKPIAKSLYEAIKLFAATKNIQLPDNIYSC